jgi:hypothetical protein
MITNVLTMSLSPAGRARAVDRDDIGKERKSEASAAQPTRRHHFICPFLTKHLFSTTTRNMRKNTKPNMNKTKQEKKHTTCIGTCQDYTWFAPHKVLVRNTRVPN